LAGHWCNKFGNSKQRGRYIKIFSGLLADYTFGELTTIITVLHDRHRARQFDVQSPAIIEYVGAQILAGRFYEGKRLEII